MGLLKLFAKTHEGALPLPHGAFTIDRKGRLISSTVSSAYPKELVAEIGEMVLLMFHQARQARLVFSEIVLNFRSFKIKAKELRGGAMVFLSPREERIGDRGKNPA
jgi:hypothetical protein